MLTIPHCKESLSRAYVTAVVGRARHNLWWGAQHDYGVDGVIKELQKRGTRIHETGFAVDFQAKSTIDWEVEDDKIVYDLEVNAYNDLVERAKGGTMPFVLILLCLHKEEDQWLEQTETELRLRNCVYWHELEGDLTNNTVTKRIHIPRANLFNTSAVEQLIATARDGGRKS